MSIDIGHVWEVYRAASTAAEIRTLLRAAAKYLEVLIEVQKPCPVEELPKLLPAS